MTHFTSTSHVLNLQQLQRKVFKKTTIQWSLQVVTRSVPEVTGTGRPQSMLARGMGRPGTQRLQAQRERRPTMDGQGNGTETPRPTPEALLWPSNVPVCTLSPAVHCQGNPLRLPQSSTRTKVPGTTEQLSVSVSPPNSVSCFSSSAGTCVGI